MKLKKIAGVKYPIRATLSEMSCNRVVMNTIASGQNDQHRADQDDGKVIAEFPEKATRDFFDLPDGIERTFDVAHHLDHRPEKHDDADAGDGVAQVFSSMLLANSRMRSNTASGAGKFSRICFQKFGGPNPLAMPNAMAMMGTTERTV